MEEMASKVRRISSVAEDNVMTKPMDGSDLTNFEDALAEVVKLRKFAYDAFETFKKRGSVFETTKNLYHSSGAHFLNTNESNEHGGHRDAVMGSHDKAIKSIDDYEKKLIQKDEIVREILLAAMTPNVLFAQSGELEIMDMIDAFERVEVSKGEKIIEQGDEGNHFYVVEVGAFDVWVKAAGDKSSKKIDGVQLTDGEGFGELGLMYSKPRAATIIATEDSVVWSLTREDHHSITTYHHMKRLKDNTEMLGNVEIQDGKTLKEVFTPQELDHMAMSLEKDTVKKGEVIMRQGTSGDTLFIVQTGKVGVHTMEGRIRRISVEMVSRRASFKLMEGGSSKESPRGGGEDGKDDIKSVEDKFGPCKDVLESGGYFGEAGLLEEETRTTTCIAQEDTVLLTLDRDMVENTIGLMTDIIQGTHRLDEADETDKLTQDSLAKRYHLDMTIEDLNLISVLGAGAFGKVVMCKHKKTNKCFALKCQSKYMIIQQRLEKHVMNELHIMAQFGHPNIALIHTVLQDKRYLYFVLELLQGGELFTHAKKYYKFEESWSKFYAASVVLAYSQIHSHRIAYRDLKPENLVMDHNGYAKVVDFGLAKIMTEGKTWTVCGTPDYLAPEIITTEGHDYAVDYWALGVLIYELSAGQPPFMAEDPMEVYEKILAGQITHPSHFSKGIRDICKKLLHVSQTKRLGNTKGGIHAIMTHKWFSGFDWEGLLEQRWAKEDIPIVPDIKDPTDCRMFEPWDSSMDLDDIEMSNWKPKLPDMYTKHAEREEREMQRESEKEEVPPLIQASFG
eukprot:CAMPEP_0118658754 /NCGR_PEP_ID=MMETSP0785-20121206/14740_1 /TAXON_ID=91992 /ORGANISM="Bolidomonas pacifica, Strain CCMP 1866" /LENGTH=788 /DNA_ID=CAMNT_0006551799 /DNA_START=22 /DNA_END=2385 /DNA_ORIENTATION=-